VAGALLRFVTLGDQSLWYDEGLTRELVLKPFGSMIDAVADTENTPPLSYVLTHLSTQLAGTDEVALRLVSAIAGTAAVAVAFFGGRELAGARAGLCAAALVAANPLLLWFSQEARSYALLSVLTAIAFVCFLRVIAVPGRWALAGWALSTALALTTHYFAIFPAAAEAVWMIATLARSQSRRLLAPAIAAVGVAAVAVAPLAISQEASGRAESLTDEGLAQRIAQVPKQFLVGYDGPLQDMLTVLSAVLVLVAAAGLWRIRHRRGVIAAVVVTLAAVLVPVAAAVLGADFLNARNVLPGLVPVLILAAAGFAALPQPWGLLAAITLAAVGVVTIIGVNGNASYQRTDWRSIDEAIGESQGPRLLVASPEGAEVPLRAYRAGITPASEPLRTRELVLAAAAVKTSAGGAASPPRPEPPVVPGFRLVEREQAPTYTLYRYRAPRAVEVDPQAVAGSRLAPSASVLFVPLNSAAAAP
jgi:uncharacterized membrane protein